MNKNSKEHTKSNKTKYSWQFWCLISVAISIFVVVILLAMLSIKALIQDIQLISYENKVEGTVTVSEFKGKRWDETETGPSLHFDEVYYIITFDEETSGYNQYEYHAQNIYSSRKDVGTRYIVLFNNIENPKLIRKEAIMEDNIILFLFSVLLIIVIILRKKIYMWLTKSSKKFDTFI